MGIEGTNSPMFLVKELGRLEGLEIKNELKNPSDAPGQRQARRACGAPESSLSHLGSSAAHHYISRTNP